MIQTLFARTRRCPEITLVVARATAVALVIAGAPADAAEPVASAGPIQGPAHGLAMHGAPKYPPGFTAFDYANPNAPKGGTVRLSAIGTFDSLNPFILKGVPAAGIGRLHDTLMEPSLDEAFSEYGLIAETVEMPEDRRWVIFTLRKEARFSDGSPVTADDVAFSFDTIKQKGHPFYRAYYASITTAETLGPRRVKFSFADTTNRELPLIIGQLPVLSKAYWETRDFEKTTLEPPVGSGPYRVEQLDPGRSITYRLDENYWGKNVAVRKGANNFARVRYDYYRDGTVALEAFKAGEYDLRVENSAKNWATAYDFPALRQGLVKAEEIRNELPTGMQGFAFNIRRTKFYDRRVRAALGFAFDFEWANQNLFYGAYTRTESYFSNSELAASAAPRGEELEILSRYRGQIPEEVFEAPYRAPTTGDGVTIRDNLRTALRLFEQAGWVVQNNAMTNLETGEKMEFEILLVSPEFERIALPYVRNLERIGVKATVRTVDTAQYQNRLDTFDFDMTVASFGQSLSPGNEQRDFWGSKSAATQGGRNIIGIMDPVVDALIEQVIEAPDRASLVARTRALDRVLLWGHYVVPHWHIRATRVAYWDRFSRPDVLPKYGFAFDTWWIDPARDERIAAARGRAAP